MNIAKEEIKKREAQEKLMKGRPGKGHIKGYKTFCKFCFTEFMIDLDKCTHCSHATMTYEVSPFPFPSVSNSNMFF